MKKNKLCHEEPAPQISPYDETYLHLSSDRKIVVAENITDELAFEFCAMLVYLDHLDPETPIEVFLHTNGGAVTGLSAMYDAIKMISAPVKTICIGKCYSAGAALLAAGAKGMRYAYKSASVMIHGVQFGFPIPGQDVKSSKSYLEFVSETNNAVIKILSDHTGKSFEQVHKDCQGDLFLTAKEALDYGLIDKII